MHHKSAQSFLPSLALFGNRHRREACVQDGPWAQSPAPQTKGQEKGKSTRWPRVKFAWVIRANRWSPPRAASYSQFPKEELSVSYRQSFLPARPGLSQWAPLTLHWPGHLDSNSAGHGVWIKPPLLPRRPEMYGAYRDDGKHLPPGRAFFFSWVGKDLVSWQLRSILLGVAGLLSKQNRACDCKGRLWASAPLRTLTSKTYLWGFIKCK